MCVIINVGESHSLTQKEIFNAVDLNSDGMGIMFLDEGRIHVFKRKKINTQKSLLSMFFEEQANFVVHLRMATHGGKTRANIHPFFITNKDWGDDEDIALVHNGVIQPKAIARCISDIQMRHTESDSAYFARALRELGVRSIEDLKSIKKDLESFLGYHNKVLFLSSEGETLEVGKFQDHKGCRVSNTYSFNEPYPKMSHIPSQGSYGSFYSWFINSQNGRH